MVFRSGASRRSRRAPLRERGDRLKAAVTHVVATEREGGKVHGPEAVVDFFEGHIFAGQRTGQKQGVGVPRDLPNRGDAADLPWAGYSIGGSRLGSDRGEGW